MNIETKILLRPRQIKPSFQGLKVEGIFNPGAIRLPNKKIMLLARVAEKPIKKNKKFLNCPKVIFDKPYKIYIEKFLRKEVESEFQNGVVFKNGICRLSTISHIKKIILDENGFNVEKIETKPYFTGKAGDGDYGVEDPRIVKLGNKYLMTYVSVSSNEGVCTSLALSNNLKYWRREGIIFRIQNKDVVIFPEKINGKYVALHRPEGDMNFTKPSIWISYSKDLIYWGKEKAIIDPREKAWDKDRIGSGCPPIKTKEGWLEIYHGVEDVNEKEIYRAGALLLDLKNPEKILARSPKDKPLFEATEKEEKKGFYNNVVFPTGAILSLDKKSLLIYSGGADSVISVRKIRIKDILNHMEYF